MVDQEGGRVARLKPPHWRAHPPAATLGRLFATNPAAGLRAAWLTGALIGLDCRAAGFTIAATPVLDISIPGAHDVIGDRAFAQHPATVARLGRAVANGLLAAGVLPVGKHAPGHGRARVDSHLLLPKVADEDLSADIRPFALNADLPWMMTAHIVYDALDPHLPATLSRDGDRERHPRPDRLRRSSGDRRPGDEGTFRRSGRPGGPGAGGRLRHRAVLQRRLCRDQALLRACPRLTPAARTTAARRPRSGREPPPDAGPGAAGCRTSTAAGMNRFLFNLALAVIPVVLAITLHEAAHGYAALALGDTTARDAGRLSLNPIRHIDRVGTILLPGFLLISQLLVPPHKIFFMFGWAKPVPVGAWKFKDPRRGMALVAIAGPADELLPRLAGRPGHPDGRVSHRHAGGDPAVPALLHAVQPRARPVQPAADPAAGRRPHRGRAAAAGTGRSLGEAGESRHPDRLAGGVHPAPADRRFDPVGQALEHVLPWAFRTLFWLAGRNVDGVDGNFI